MTTKSSIDKAKNQMPNMGLTHPARKPARGAGRISRFNNSLALLITKSVGSMWCAYLFALIALISLPSAIAAQNSLVMVSWIAQTFLQLVLLPIIIVGQNVQAAASEEADRAILGLAMMQLGEQQLERHNIKSAIQCYQKAFDLDPENRATNYFLGELYIQDKQLGRGIDHLKKAIGPDFDYAPAEAALGLAYRLQGDQTTDPRQRELLYSQAKTSLLQALQIDPTALDIHGEPVQAGLGALYKREGQVAEAIQYYEEARKITPQKSYPIVNLAILYYMQGDLDQARVYFEDVLSRANDALKHTPSDYWSRFDRMTAELALGDSRSVMEDLNVISQQLKTAGPLESALGELRRLKTSPHPPQDIDQVIKRLEALRRSLSSM